MNFNEKLFLKNLTELRSKTAKEILAEYSTPSKKKKHSFKHSVHSIPKRNKITDFLPFATLSISFLETIKENNDGINTETQNLLQVPATCSFYSPKGKSVINFNCTDFSGEGFIERSNTMVKRLIEQLCFEAKINSFKYIYFDGQKGGTGLMIFKAVLACNYKLSLTMREGELFEIKVQKQKGKKKKTENLLILRDYRALLDSPLETLYKEFVDESGKIPHKKILSKEELTKNPQECLRRTRRRAGALFEVLSKFQQLIFLDFACDITQSMTISALSMRIFTTHFYKDPTIYTNTEENDFFIRQAYFGGHADLYRPAGNDVYIYDVNSLYVLSMRSDLPAGIPNWIDDCMNFRLQDLFGFIEADVICPKNIKRPLLPKSTLLSNWLLARGLFLRRIKICRGSWLYHQTSQGFTF